MPRAEDKRRECRYCGLKRGMKVGSDMCFDCDRLYQMVRDHWPALMKIVKLKFPNFIFAKKEVEPELSDAEVAAKVQEHEDRVNGTLDEMIGEGEPNEPTNPNP